jgi:hypothetical protein
MALLFVGGIMNVLWIVLLALLILLEKIPPLCRLIASLAGTVLIATGAWLLLRECLDGLKRSEPGGPLVNWRMSPWAGTGEPAPWQIARKRSHRWRQNATFWRAATRQTDDVGDKLSWRQCLA